MTLATIQRIDKLTPIHDADFIETAYVLGWTVVVKKGEFKEGDLCIYIEIDSIIPRKEWSEFLFKGENETKYRLRTIKLKKQLSQGLVLPISVIFTDIIPDLTLKDKNPAYMGEDVSDILEIKHYEKPINDNPRSGMQAKANFPSFLRKTDEVRIQSAPELLEQLRGRPYYITQKLDGTSATYYKHKGKFGVCSRNLELKDPTKSASTRLNLLWDKILGFFGLGRFKNTYNPRGFSLNVYWQMAYKYNIMEWLPDGFAIQGEICGPSIQGNKLGLKENELFVFNYFDIDRQSYSYTAGSCRALGMYRQEDWWTERVGVVPIIDYGDTFKYTLEKLLELAEKGVYPNGTPQEGIIVRSPDQTISFKVVSNKFLLKYNE